MGALLVYDVANYKSFEKVGKWLDELRRHAAQDVAVVLVGNKSDKLDHEREVWADEGRAYAVEKGIGFIETSACIGTHVSDAFTMVSSDIMLMIEQSQFEEFDDKDDRSEPGEATAIGEPIIKSLA